jgi:hypothetical protein
MATALTRMLEDEQDLETLILCPKNLVSMWQDYREPYGLRGRVMSYTRVLQELPWLKLYRLIILDESHNLRNRRAPLSGDLRLHSAERMPLRASIRNPL